MIYIEYGDVAESIEPESLVCWMFGLYQKVPPGTIHLENTSINVTIDAVHTRKHLYAISLGKTSVDLPSTWAIPWASGLAASHGHDLRGMLDNDLSMRAREMQALMICHNNGWLVYHGVR